MILGGQDRRSAHEPAATAAVEPDPERDLLVAMAHVAGLVGRSAPAQPVARDA